MSLPSPNLDDRRFQDIVDEVKQQIGRYCPTWTDHNVSDPGVTLVELFAWMTEMTLYRLNQVPEKNYIKFLEMIGVTLEPPTPARTDLWFRLSRPIEDEDGEEAYERVLRARETVAATVRTETEESLDFSTDTDLRLVRPRLAHILALPPTPREEFSGDQVKQGDFRNWHPAPRDDDEVEQRGNGFPIFGTILSEGAALYLGFEADVSRNLVELEADCVWAAAANIDEEYPLQAWEVWNGIENRWEGLAVQRDTTFGFNRPPGQMKDGLPTGLIELPMPAGLVTRQIADRRAYWVRCRYLPNRWSSVAAERGLAPYRRSPEIRELNARVIGGIAPASNCITVVNKDLGVSDGTPGQVFTMGHAPILHRRRGDTVLVGTQGAPLEEWQTWEEVSDFSMSRPRDRHFVCDGFAGEILFGPNVLQPDGSMHQHGEVPERGKTIRFSAFQYGGGVSGNVAPGQIDVLKSSIPYIAGVTNPGRADGGREQETLERAKLRGRQILRLRDRAVTPEDFEHLAVHIPTGGVGRARCVPRRPVHDAGPNGDKIPPGVVRVLLVPAMSDAVTAPRPAELRVPPRVRQEVLDYLDERRLLTTVLEVGEPDYVFVSTHITLVADPKANAEQVARRVRERLEKYIHPLHGGPNNDGWPFERTLTLSDIYAQVQAPDSGVAFLLDARIYTSRLKTGEEGLSDEVLIPSIDGVRLGVNELLCTREHRIIPRPMGAVGTEEARLAGR